MTRYEELIETRTEIVKKMKNAEGEEAEKLSIQLLIVDEKMDKIESRARDIMTEMDYE
jgi:predicted RecB family nuclease